jgi:serine/threonine protein kinase/tetratricopeptide (TPR) repeat protein
MAEVFKAKSYGVEGFEKVVVIKRILPDLAKSKEFVDMFIHEAKLAVRLSHANIVQVFDLGLATASDSQPPGGEAKNAYYMAMEYVHGFDLATVLSKCRRQQRLLPIDMCVYVASEVAKGLDHAHRRRDEQLKPLGIVHRDVSPQNVLLSLEGEVKVTDFGIAKARGALDSGTEDTLSRKLHGKFGYMSPEQARGDAVDGRSDLFSLGTVLYECIAGVNPFSAPTTFETLRRVQAGEYPPVELLRPDCPPELVAIVKTAMMKSAQDRYADAGRMYEALVAFLYSQGRRYGSNELAELMGEFRTQAEEAARAPQIADAALEEPGHGTNEKTPVEIPSARPPASVSPPSRVDTGVRVVDRAAGMGERREISALAIELPDREHPQLGEKAEQIALRYGGRIVKREPEQVTVLFGLGEQDGRDTEVATRCALVALRALEGPRRPSAGVHTGRIHVSADGEPTQDERFAGLLSTARELARVREGACAVSAPAMRQIRSLFLLEPVTDAEQTAVGSAASLVKDVRGPAEAFGRFVGRKEELRKIGEVLASATKRAARVLTIRGDHGTGKTRLLVEVERRLRKGGYNVGWYMAACPPRGRELPLSGIIAMLQVLCGVAEGDAPDRVLEVQPRLRALGMNDEEVAATLSVLGAGVPSPPGNMKSMLRNAFSRMVASLCEDRPTTFAWDAAHGMDADSFAILESAFQRLVHVRVVLVLAARAGFSHPLEKLVAHTALDLSDLSLDDSARLVGFRLGVEKVPDELVTFVRERAGGHPLFIEEVIKALVDARAVTIAEKRVVAMKLLGQDLALPKTLRGLVAARVARLSPEDRAILQAAAVLGDPFTQPVLAQMTAVGMSQLEKSIATFRERDLLVHTGPSELRFTSPIVREVVVDALPQQALREMHGVAGLALETVLGDAASEHAARIATHLYEAGDRDRAATYFAKSGERRLEGRQLEAASRDYARAIALCDIGARDPRELAGWLRGLSSAVRLVRALPEATETCERIVTRLDDAGDLALRVGARVDAGRILGALHQFEAAAQYFQAAEKIAQGNEALVKTALVAAAEQTGRQGDFTKSLEHLEKLQKIATVEGDKQEEHRVLISLSQANSAIGDKRTALAYLERAEQLLPSDATATCERQKLRSLIEYFARDYRAASAACERAVDMARDLGLSYEVAVNLHNLADILVRVDDFARAYGALQQSLALCDESGFERLASHNRMFLAFLDAVRGDADADKRLIQGIRYAEANDFTWDVIGGRLMLAQLLQRRGDYEAAKTEFLRLREIARAAGNRLVADDCDAALQAMATGAA